MTQNKSHLLLAHYLKQLKLPTILREYAAVVAACTQDRCDYVSFLLRLVEREALDREQRAAERRIQNARFPLLKTLDPFDFTAQPSLSEKLIRELRGVSMWSAMRTCCSSATVARARPIWRVPWGSPAVRRAAACASSRSRPWSPICWR